MKIPDGWADSESAPVLQDENGAGNQACPRSGERRRRPAMPSVRRTATLPLAFVVCVLAVAGVAATPGVAVGSLAAAGPHDQDPSAGEASLALDRSTRRLIQQRRRNEGFDPGTPDGLFGPPTRAAIRDWQQSRGASPTGYLNGAEAELLRTAAAPPPAVPEAPPPPQAVPAVHPSSSSAAAPRPSTLAETDSNPAPAIVATEESRPAERRDEHPAADACRPRDGDRPTAARNPARPPPPAGRTALGRRRPRSGPRAMNEILALQEEHDLELHQPHHPVAADPLALLPQVLVHAGAAVSTPVRLVRGPNQHPQLLVPSGMGRSRPVPPSVEPARRNLENPPHRSNAEGGLLRLAEREPHTWSLAKRSRELSWDLPLRSQGPDVFPQPPQLLAFLGCQARAALGTVRPRVLDPAGALDSRGAILKGQSVSTDSWYPGVTKENNH